MTIKRKRRRAPKEGDVFLIPLNDGTYGFGQVCHKKDYAFFDLRTEDIPSINDIVSHRVIFRVPMFGNPASEEGWTTLGNTPLKGPLAESACYRNQPVGSNQLYLYKESQLTPASLDEVKDLELFAWWTPFHIIERLLDHFEGRPNRTVEFFRRIKVYDPKTGQEIDRS